MDFPPGLVYLRKTLPHFLLPSFATYFLVVWLKSELSISIPPWAIVLIALFARPLIFLVQRRYRTWSDAQAARTHGAIIPPFVQQSAWATIKEVEHMVKEGYPAEALLRWTQEYGDVVQLDTLTSKLLVTNEPNHVKAILATQFNSFGKGTQSMDASKSLLGDGIFNVNGDIWKFHRAITRPFFTRERISDFEIYNRNCDLSLTSAKNRLAEGHSIDVQDLFGRFTLDSATEFLFGAKVGSLLAELPYSPGFSYNNTDAYYKHPSNIFVDAFNQGLDYTEARSGRGREWGLWEFGQDKIKPLRKIMDDFTQPMIDKALANRIRQMSDTSGDSEVKETETVLTHLVSQTQDPQLLKDELLNLLVAGRDTTMCLLTFSVYMLSQHPNVEDRLRREIFNIVGPSAQPEYNQIREMKYLRAFLNEVLRLYPPVPIDGRMSFENVVLPNTDPNKPSFYVTKDTQCLYSVINIQRRTDLWGPDALEFDPDRFIDERLHKYLTPNPYIFCPFNAGPRICLGQQFAYHEASYYLIRLLQHFTEFTLDTAANIPPPASWALGEGTKPREKIHPMSHLTMYIKGGLWVRMKELNKSSKV